MAEVSIRRGRMIAYRMFDLASEIDLALAERLVSGREGASRLRIEKGGAGRGVVVRDAPVTLSLGSFPIRLGSESVEAETVCRVWSYGIVSIQFHIQIPGGTPWGVLVRLAALAETDNDLDDVAGRRIQEVSSALDPALKGRHAFSRPEDYVIHLLQELEGATASELLDRADVASLILGEATESLSPSIRETTLSARFSYSPHDLTVVDWNSALVVDPSGGSDVSDILEFAVTHLAEFRYVDSVLDDRIERLYDAVERRQPMAFLRGDYERLSREAGSLFLEFSEYVERVENSLKFVGDLYLAMIFRAAASRFRLREWEESIGRKLNALARISELLHAEVNVRRSHLLELIIIILIAYEIISVLWN